MNLFFGDYLSSNLNVKVVYLYEIYIAANKNAKAAPYISNLCIIANPIIVKKVASNCLEFSFFVPTAVI